MRSEALSRIFGNAVTFYHDLAFGAIVGPTAFAEEARTVLMFPPMKDQCLEFIELERNPIKSDGSFNVQLGDMESVKLLSQKRQWYGWLQGFMTAANVFELKSPATLGENTDPTGWVSWLVDWCHANPSKRVSEGAFELRKALPGKN